MINTAHEIISEQAEHLMPKEYEYVYETLNFNWMHRADTIPDLEVIYSLELPSGAEYRFVLKNGKGEGLRFKNDDSFSEEDLKIIKEIEVILAGDIERLKTCVTELNLSKNIENTTLTKKDIDRPYEIQSLDDYRMYHNLRLREIWSHFF